MSRNANYLKPYLDEVETMRRDADTMPNPYSDEACDKRHYANMISRLCEDLSRPEPKTVTITAIVDDEACLMDALARLARDRDSGVWQVRMRRESGEVVYPNPSQFGGAE